MTQATRAQGSSLPPPLPRVSPSNSRGTAHLTPPPALQQPSQAVGTMQRPAGDGEVLQKEK